MTHGTKIKSLKCQRVSMHYQTTHENFFQFEEHHNKVQLMQHPSQF